MVGPCSNCPRRGEVRGNYLDDVAGKWCGTRGPLDSDLTVIGIAPGKHELISEDGVGPRPFVGGSGRVLNAALGSGGINFFGSAHAFNVIDCYPMGADDQPTVEQLSACSARFERKLQAITPKVILLLGNEPLNAVCQFKGAKNSISHWDGYLIRKEDLATDVYAKLPSTLEALIATYHPAYVMRTGQRKFPWFRRMVTRAARATRGQLSVVIPPIRDSNPDSLAQSSSAAFDIETRYPINDDIIRVGIGWLNNGKVEAVSSLFDFRGMALTEEAFKREQVIIFNANFDMPRLIDSDVITLDTLFRIQLIDPMWAAAILDPDAPGYSLNACFAAWCDGHRWKHMGGPGKRPKKPKCKEHKTTKECTTCSASTLMWDNPVKGERRCQQCATKWYRQAYKEHDVQEAVYNRQDAYNLYPLWQAMRNELVSTGQMKLFLHEMYVLPMLINIHMNGLNIDTAVRDRLKQIYDKWATRAEKIWETESGGVNPRSPKQLFELLYDKWGMPPQYKEVKEGGRKVKKITTEKEALQSLAKLARSPERKKALVALIHARHRRKFYVTYLDVSDHVYPSYAPGSKDDADKGKAFTVSAATGRIVAKSGNYRGVKTFPAQQMPKPVRTMVIASPGNKLVATDWSSQELRIVAALSGDPVLLEQIAQEDMHSGDKSFSIHSINAEVLGIDRTRAKNAFYGTIYGGTWKAILRSFRAAGYTHVEPADAKELVKLMHSQYVRLFEWHRELMHEASTKGYLTDGWDRRRYFADPSSNFNEIVNFKVQSSGSGMQWTVVPEVYNLAREYDGWLIIPMHDEEVCDMPEGILEEFIPRKQAIMLQEFPQIAPGFTCPVETKVGWRWDMRRSPVWCPATVQV